MQQYVAEFVGTMLLIIFGDGVVAGVLLRNSKAENSGWIVITFGWAMGVAIAVYTVGRISGAHINPAVTLGLATLELFGLTDVPNFGLVDVVPYIIAQFLGAFVGGVLVWLAYLPHWRHTEDPGLKLGVFCTAPAYRNTTANLITEIIGTAVLLFGVLGIASNAAAIGTSGGVDVRVAELGDAVDRDHDGHSPPQGDDDPARVLRLGVPQQNTGDHSVTEDDEEHRPDELPQVCLHPFPLSRKVFRPPRCTGRSGSSSSRRRA